MNCAKCGYKNDPAALFCEQCGSKILQIVCVKCGFENDPDALFCESCGSKLDQIEQDIQAPITTEHEPDPDGVQPPENTVEEQAPDTAVSPSEEDCPDILTEDTAANNVVSTDEETEEKTRFKLKLPSLNIGDIPVRVLGIALACVVIVIIGCIILFRPSAAPVIFVRDGQLVMREKRKPVLIHDEFATGKSGIGNNSPDTLAGLAQLSSDDKYLYYLTDYNDGYSLYCIELSRIGKDTPTKISSSVSFIYIPKKDNGVYFLKNLDGITGKLYHYDHTTTAMIAKDVLAFPVSASGNFVIYLKQKADTNENALYLYNRKAEEESKLDTNVSMLYTAKLSPKPSDILYSKYGDTAARESVYLTAYETEKQKLVNNAYVHSASLDAIFYTTEDNGNIVLYRYDYSDAAPERICDKTKNCQPLSQDVITYYDMDDKANYIVLSNGIKLESIDTCYGAAISNDGSQLILLENSRTPRSEQSGFTMTSYTIEKGGLTEQYVFSEDACSDCYYDAESKAVYYFEDVDSKSNGTLYRYMKGETIKIADDVNTETVHINSTTSSVAFFSDSSDEIGTLNIFDGKKCRRIDSDVSVSNWDFSSEDTILYLKNWDAANGGEFYLYTGKKSDRIASDVQSFINTAHSLPTYRLARVYQGY